MIVLWLNGKGKEATWEVLLVDIDQSELARKVKTTITYESLYFVSVSVCLLPQTLLNL